MAVSKRTRYEVLRRDDNTCRYCGGRAPEVVLTIDHVVPTALGGTDDPSNLVAACKDCNAGKSSSSPDAALVAQASEDAIRWSAAMQVAAGKMRDDFQAEWDYAEALDDEWSGWTYGYQKRPVPRPPDWRNSTNAWRTAGLPADLMVDAARRALSNDRIGPDSTWKYFCGIAWNRITEIQKSAKASLVDPEEADATCDGLHDCECQAEAHWQGILWAGREATTALPRLIWKKLSQTVDGQQPWNRSSVDV